MPEHDFRRENEEEIERLRALNLAPKLQNLVTDPREMTLVCRAYIHTIERTRQTKESFVGELERLFVDTSDQAKIDDMWSTLQQMNFEDVRALTRANPNRSIKSADVAANRQPLENKND